MTRRYLTIAVIAFVAALAGVFLGQWLMPKAPPPGAELHAVLHERLDLDADQERALERLEARFAVSRRAFEDEMRAENRALAAAIAAEHGDGPRVAAAVDASHRTMGALQKATIAHIFAMRALLRPDQAAAFDAAVTRALTEAHQ
ncbi:periplasmic heavy metal sensor [Sphingomonas sp. S1-29]|uniref:periplasmic heavy metal sensor n=1 Tax=Sphingomonas sp. S1-29 TaxID=2991074 RepID=UPI00223FE4FB|nr:periplasmic heavy metal sensor [Sphingomonas sp. S1-29]UZK70331.1 periplasmic heavy metal sensor [Sphingomonas sp. S1-29]